MRCTTSGKVSVRAGTVAVALIMAGTAGCGMLAEESASHPDLAEGVQQIIEASGAAGIMMIEYNPLRHQLDAVVQGESGPTFWRLATDGEDPPGQVAEEEVIWNGLSNQPSSTDTVLEALGSLGDCDAKYRFVAGEALGQEVFDVAEWCTDDGGGHGTPETRVDHLAGEEVDVAAIDLSDLDQIEDQVAAGMDILGPQELVRAVYISFDGEAWSGFGIEAADAGEEPQGQPCVRTYRFSPGSTDTTNLARSLTCDPAPGQSVGDGGVPIAELDPARLMEIRQAEEPSSVSAAYRSYTTALEMLAYADPDSIPADIVGDPMYGYGTDTFAERIYTLEGEFVTSTDGP